jgi:hypothetical protein
MIYNTTTPEKIESLLLDNPEQHIPHGMYCYTFSLGEKHIRCPFWDYDDELPLMENGYCHYLKVSDFEVNPTRNRESKISESTIPEEVGKFVSEVFGDHYPASLLWDECKECGINIENPNEYDRLEESAGDIV